MQRPLPFETLAAALMSWHRKRSRRVQPGDVNKERVKKWRSDAGTGVQDEDYISSAVEEGRAARRGGWEARDEGGEMVSTICASLSGDSAATRAVEGFGWGGGGREAGVCWPAQGMPDVLEFFGTSRAGVSQVAVGDKTGQVGMGEKEEEDVVACELNVVQGSVCDRDCFFPRLLSQVLFYCSRIRARVCCADVGGVMVV